MGSIALRAVGGGNRRTALPLMWINACEGL